MDYRQAELEETEDGRVPDRNYYFKNTVLDTILRKQRRYGYGNRASPAHNVIDQCESRTRALPNNEDSNGGRALVINVKAKMPPVPRSMLAADRQKESNASQSIGIFFKSWEESSYQYITHLFIVTYQNALGVRTTKDGLTGMLQGKGDLVENGAIVVVQHALGRPGTRTGPTTALLPSRCRLDDGEATGNDCLGRLLLPFIGDDR